MASMRAMFSGVRESPAAPALSRMLRALLVLGIATTWGLLAGSHASTTWSRTRDAQENHQSNISKRLESMKSTFRSNISCKVLGGLPVPSTNVMT